MNLIGKFMDQYRKPSGWLGRVVARGMNAGHWELTEWGLGHIDIAKYGSALDIGCGGGETIRKLAEADPHSRLYGIDHSPESVAVAVERNAPQVRAGRVDIRPGSVSSLPFPGAMFHLVLAIETHYFWPDLESDAREILRVMRGGGTLMIIGEGYAGGKFDDRNRKLARWAGMRFYGIREIEEILTRAGFAEIRMFEEYDKGWFCALARKGV
ncbi:MAG: methyltransferase domain-containing protein [Anaerolineales bacterium]|nr:methyltransferase domain-containing protein [Anaerolineales bacterium]